MHREGFPRAGYTLSPALFPASTPGLSVRNRLVAAKSPDRLPPMNAPSGSVLVTGASTGIGEACTALLAAQGYRVYAGVRKDADGARLRAAHGERIEPLRLDITDAEHIAAAARTLAERTGADGLDALVNNAGVAFSGPLEYLPLDDLRKQFEINVFGHHAVTQACLPLLRLATGRIVNMSSICGRLTMPFIGPYVASKFALEALTDALRMELRPWKIRVVLVEPGSIRTPLWDKADHDNRRFADDLPEQARVRYGTAIERFRDRAVKVGRQGLTPEAVARVVLRALKAKRPKARYLVGRDAKLGAALLPLVPDGWKDYLTLSQIGLPK